jgi:hypothetical protein
VEHSGRVGAGPLRKVIEASGAERVRFDLACFEVRTPAATPRSVSALHR